MVKKIYWLLGGLLVVGLILSALYAPQLQRLYYTLTLFDEDRIVQNFSNMSAMYDTVEIAALANSFKFNERPQALPETFNYKNEERSVAEFLSRTNTTALLVLKEGEISYEDYFLGTTEADYRISWSTAKSFLSALFGIAVEEGHIKSLDTPVSDYDPRLKNSGYDGVSIKDVLQMSSGVRFDEDYMAFNSDINRFGRTFALGGSIDDFALSLVNEREPGSFLHYVSIDTHVLGMVLRAATGRTIQDYFSEKLWSKLQPESSVFFIVDNENEPMVLGGMNLRTRDFAKLGLLYLNGGKWNGEQVVAESWVRQSVTPDAPHLMPGERDSSDLSLGYGYQWWLPVNADQEFMAIGVYDQFIFVDEKSGVVIVKNSANTRFADNNFESAHETTAFFRSVVKSLDSE